MTLVEVLMSVTLFSVSAIMLSSFIIYGYKNHMRVTEEALATDRVNANIRVMVEELRKAKTAENGSYVIATANSDEVSFYSDIDRDLVAEKVTYEIVDGDLVKSVIEPTGTPPQYPAGNVVTKVIAEGLSNDEIHPLFIYYGVDPLGEGNNVELSAPVELTRVRLVEVSLLTEIGDTGNSRVVESKALIRNLREF